MGVTVSHSIIKLPIPDWGFLEMTGETPESEIIQETQITLFEDALYSYRLVIEQGVQAEWKNASLIKPSKLDVRYGTIDTLNESGFFRPVLILQRGGLRKQISWCWKVQPRKLTELQQSWMLRDIATFAGESIVDLRSPVSAVTRYQYSQITLPIVAFSLLRKWYLEKAMRECLAQILHAPHQHNHTTQTQLRPFGYGAMQWVGNPTSWRKIPPTHALSGVLKMLPEVIPMPAPSQTFDTQENRIVVRILHEVLQYISVGEKYTPDLCQKMQCELLHVLSSPIWQGIDPAENLTRPSLVFTQRAGYRELWNFWHQLQNTNLLFTANPNGEIEKRSNEQLYEMWLLVGLLRGFSHHFGQPETQYANPFQRGATFVWHLSEYKIQLAYNRTFSGESLSGSWSTTLRPDFTISYWSEKLRVRHIHFDAKYRQSQSGEFLREDLHKMHTYRDAIHNSIGAYVMFPVSGNVELEPMLFQSGDKQSGVGAFPVYPLENESELPLKAIFDFLQRLFGFLPRNGDD